MATTAAPVHAPEEIRVIEGEEISLARATELSKVTFLGDNFVGKPHNVWYGMEIGKALGLPAAVALQHIHVFETKKGKIGAAMSAHMMQGLATKAGHILQVEGTEDYAKATLIRGDSIVGRMLKMEFDSEQMKVAKEAIDMAEKIGLDVKKIGIFEITWTIEDAETAQLTGKQNWQKHPAEMLKSRAKSNAIRAGAPEVLLGCPYTPDELGSDIDEDGTPLITNLGRSQKIQNSASVIQETTPSPTAASPFPSASAHETKTPPTTPTPTQEATPPEASQAHTNPLQELIAGQSAKEIVAWSEANAHEDGMLGLLHTELGRTGAPQKIAEWAALMQESQLPFQQKRVVVVSVIKSVQACERLGETVELEDGIKDLNSILMSLARSLKKATENS